MTKYLTVEAQGEVVKALTTYLANSTVVYYKTHAFHWNVKGSEFYSLHLLFEKFYQEIWESLDETAERIRALGGEAPESLTELLKLSTIREATSSPAHTDMVKILKEDFLELAKNAHDAGEVADKHLDRVTTDMMTAQAGSLEKAAWMLRSTITG